MFQMTMKAGREDECAVIAKDLMATTRAQDRDCINYTFFRRADNPRELMLYEQWQDIDALNAHLGWRTPAEALDEVLQSAHTGSVATTS
jgi:quinol monooxygenase YgiN